MSSKYMKQNYIAIQNHLTKNRYRTSQMRQSNKKKSKNSRQFRFKCTHIPIEPEIQAEQAKQKAVESETSASRTDEHLSNLSQPNCAIHSKNQTQI